MRRRLFAAPSLVLSALMLKVLANPINYSTIFGHDASNACAWFLQAKATGFAPVSERPFCGTDIPGTSTASAS
jgi:hypothetical protein